MQECITLAREGDRLAAILTPEAFWTQEKIDESPKLSYWGQVYQRFSKLRLSQDALLQLST